MRNSIKSGCMDNRSSGWLIHDRFIHWMEGKTVGLSDGMLIEKINQQKLSCGGFFLKKKRYCAVYSYCIFLDYTLIFINFN